MGFRVVKRITLLFIVMSCTLWGQFNSFNPDYKWLTIKGEHVYVHFHEGAERTAKIVAKIGDEVWDPITSLYQYEPEVVHYVIKDIDDYSNGATYFFDNKIEIWASALDFDLRGAHNWLRNVISHEFTHMVQIQASMKVGRRVPAFYLQYLNYEDKRRPDILYGFPNFIASYPIATINMPAWFAEGTAQYMREEFHYDTWDSHRDMIMRSYALDNNMLTWNEMGVFGKTSLGNESVYNSGFALTRYISQKYGEDKLREITNALGKWNNVTIDAAFEDVLGKDGDEIYEEWSNYLKEDYKKRISAVKENFVAGDTIGTVGFGNFYPHFSDDGKKIYYVSNKYNDYFGAGIFEYDIETKKEKMLQWGVRSTLAMFPGTDKIVYSKLSDDNPKGTVIHDLFVYDISEEEETRLTHGIRANAPSISPDGKTIVFLFQKDGSSNIGLIDADGENFRALTFFNRGEQVFNPTFTPDSKTIVFDYGFGNGRDIAKVEIEDPEVKFLMNESYDERNPVFAKDGTMYFASDKTGIYNLYKKSPEGEVTRITNVTGGAFMPSVDGEGNVAYAGYTSTGYKLFMISPDVQNKVDDSKQYVQKAKPPLGSFKRNGDMANFPIDSLRNYDDKTLPEYDINPYKGQFTDLTFVPFIRYDNYSTSNNAVDKIKPGLYVMSNDILNRTGLFAGGAINKRMERDLFLTFEYRNKLPLLYDIGIKPELALELYSISRKANALLQFDTLDTSQDVHTDVTYDLFEVDLVAKHKIFNSATELEARYIYSNYSNTISSFIIPISGSSYPTTTDDYYKSSNFQVKLTHEAYLPNVDSDINPKGRFIELQYNYEMNDFNPDYVYDEDSGTLRQVFENYNLHKLELNYKEYIPVWRDHVLTFQARGASILGNSVDDFFDYYLGGLIGMKAYPFYAVSGNELAWFNLTYRFPLIKRIDKRFKQLYIDKVYMSVYADYGDAWTGKAPSFDEFKKGAGAELRIKMNSFYLFPTSIFFSAAYSFDKVTRYIESFNETVNYGEEWRFYGGILFDFNF